MAKNTSLLVIGLDGAIIDKINGYIVSTNQYANVVQVVAPFPDTDSVSLNFYLRNARISNYSQYMKLLRNSSGEVILAKDIIDSEKTYYQTVKDWNVWTVGIDSKALRAISKYHSGKVDVTTTFRSFRNLLIEDTGTYIGTFGSNKSFTGGDLPVSASEGDFYKCDYLDYYSFQSSLDFTLLDLAIWSSGVWTKGIAYEFRMSSPSTEFGVDAAIMGQAVEDIESSATEKILNRISAVESSFILSDSETFITDNFVRSNLETNYNELTTIADTDVMYIERGLVPYHISLDNLGTSMEELSANIIRTNSALGPVTGQGFYADENNVLIGSATGNGISWDSTQGLFFRGTIQAGTITDPDLLAELKGEPGNDGADGSDGADGYTPVYGVDYFNGADGSSFNYIGILPLLTSLNLISNPSKGDAYRITETEELWSWNGALWKNMGVIRGLPGTDGENGLSAYLHIAWATAADGSTGFSTSVSTNKTYIGQYTDFSASDSQVPATYKWSLIKGADGADGTDGINGTSAYLHIAYANSADGITGFSTTVSTDKLYIGQYTNSSPTDSTTPGDYSWTKIVGNDGTDGSDGSTFYLHIAYATNITGTTGFSTTDSVGKTYIGTYTDTNLADSSNPALYSWALFKGADGNDGSDGTSVSLLGTVATVGDLPASGNTIGDLWIVDADGDGYTWNGSAWSNVGPIQGPAGADGVDGLNAYIHYAYATSSDGITGFSTTPFTGALYIGYLADFTLADSTTPGDYDWSLFKGADGADGSDGANGLAAYIHYAYATSSDGQTSFSTTYFTGATYVGWYTDFVSTDSTTYTDYEWSLFKGSDGLDGADGDNGLNAYIHYAYATNITGTTDFSLSYTGSETYIGWYSDFTVTDSTNAGDYEWSLFKGADGIDGADGPVAKRVEITGKNLYKFLKDTTVPTYTSITLTAQLFGDATVYDWDYSNNGGSTWSTLSNTTSTYTNTYNNAIWTSDTLLIRCTSDTATDIFSLYKVYDGATGIDALSASLSNENFNIPTLSDGTSPDFTGVTGQVTVLYGLLDKTTESTFSIVGGTEDTTTWYLNSNDCVLSINKTTGAFFLAQNIAWTTDTETFVIRSTYGGYSIDRTVRAVKAKNGSDGTDGADGSDGAQGPGLEYRGDYVPGYYYYDANRRSVVTYPAGSQTYYAANQYITPGTWNATLWTPLTYFKAIATDILLAQDATITKGLTIGADSTATGTFIRSYDKTSLSAGDGFYISGNGDFNFGNTLEYIDWNGSALSIKGDISADNLTINNDLTVTNDIILGTGGEFHSLNMDTITDSTGGVFINSDGDFCFGDPAGYRMTWNGSNLEVIKDLYEFRWEYTTDTNFRLYGKNNTGSSVTIYYKAWLFGTEPAYTTNSCPANTEEYTDFTVSPGFSYHYKIKFGLNGPEYQGYAVPIAGGSSFTNLTTHYMSSQSGGAIWNATRYCTPMTLDLTSPVHASQGSVLYKYELHGYVDLTSNAGTYTINLADSVSGGTIIVSPAANSSLGSGGNLAYGYKVSATQFKIVHDYATTTNSKRIGFMIVGHISQRPNWS